MKKFLCVILASVLLAAVCAFAACNMTSGEINGFYKEVDEESFEQIKKIDTAQIFGNKDEQGVKISADYEAGIVYDGGSASVSLNANGTGSVADVQKTPNLTAALQSKLMFKADKKLLNMIASSGDEGDGEEQSSATATEMFDKDVDAEANGKIYFNGDALYLDYTATGVPQQLVEGAEAAQLAKGGKYFYKPSEDVIGATVKDMLDSAKAFLTEADLSELSWADVKQTLNAYGLKLEIDSSNGLKLKLCTTDGTAEMVQAKINKALEPETEGVSIFDGIIGDVKISKLNAEVYLQLDSDNLFKACAENVELAASAKFMQKDVKLTLDAKTNVEVGTFTVDLPKDFEGYTDIESLFAPSESGENNQ